MGKNVPDEFLQPPDESFSSDPREQRPHITVLYGIEDENPESLRKSLRGFGRVRVRFGPTGFFSVEEKGFDVVKVDVISEDLKRLRKAVERASRFHTDFPDYQPHSTIAYVKPQAGKKFSGDRTLSGERVEFDALTFCGADGKRAQIPLA
jgi:2'-5' RNA ligase